MRHSFTISMLLSFLLVSGSGMAYADNHRDNNRARHEQRDHGNNKHAGRNSSKNRPGDKGQGNKFDKHHDNGKHNGNNWNKHNSAPRPGYGQNNGHRPGAGHPGYGRPGVGVPHHHAPAPRPNHYHPSVPPPPPHLSNMVRYATRGCHDVAVWQIDPVTFIVRYRRGSRYYTQRIYPYANRYDNPSLISVNWAPLSPWTLIPSINLNINL